MPSRTRIMAAMAVALALVGALSPGAVAAVPKAVTYDYSTYTYPGAREVQIAGDNARGVLVGTEGSIGRVRAFYLIDHRYHLLTVPFGHATSVAGITNGGEIVGSYAGKSGLLSGWIRNAKTHHYTRFSIPGSQALGAVGTWPESVSPYGVISGLYFTYDRKDKEQVEHGFYGRPGSFKTYTLERRVAKGFTPGSGLYFYRSGVYGGAYNQATDMRAFYVDDGALHTVVDPYDNNAKKYVDTYLVGVDGAGVLYGDSVSVAKGHLADANSFRDDDGVFESIADPKAAAPDTSTGTSIAGVTPAGVLFGTYATNDRGGLAGFVAVPIEGDGAGDRGGRVPR